MHKDSPQQLIKFVAKSGMIIFLGSLVGKILRFIFYVIIIRSLGASLYGLYSLGQSIIDILTDVALLGGGKGVIRYGVEFLEKNDLPRTKGIILIYLVLCCLISVFIALFLFVFSGYISEYFFHEGALNGVIKVFALAFPFYIFAITSIFIGFIFRKVTYKVVVQEIFHPAVSIVSVAVLFALGWRLYGAVGAFAISSVASAFLGAYLIIRVFPALISKGPFIFETKRLVLYSLSPIFILFSYYCIFRIDRIILGMYRSVYEVGIYSAINNAAVMILAFSSIFEAGFGPVVTQLSCNGDTHGLKKMYNLVTIWGFSLIFLPAFCLIIFNREVLSLFGVEFQSAGWILVILVLALFIEIIPGQLKLLFQMSSRQNMELLNSLGMIMINVLFNILLIPRFGMAGAAFALLFTFVFITIVRSVETGRVYHFSPFTLRYLKLLIYISCALIIGIKYILGMDLIYRIIFTIIVMAGFGFISYKLKTSEDLLVWEAVRKRFFLAAARPSPEMP